MSQDSGNAKVWAALAVGLTLGFLARPWIVSAPVEPVRQQATDKVSPSEGAYDALVPEKQQFVANEYHFALELYKSGAFEKCIYELSKLHDELPGGYKDSKDLERYARKSLEAGKEALERKSRDDLAEKSRLATQALIEQAEASFAAGKYDEAKQRMIQVIEIDPENTWTEKMRARLADHHVSSH